MNDQILLPGDCSETVSADEVELRFAIPFDYEYLKGHFPDAPLVPGVTQIGWVLQAIRRLRPIDAFSVSRYRFVKPILPGQRVLVSAKRSGSTFACSVHADGELASKGVVSEKGADDGV